MKKSETSKHDDMLADCGGYQPIIIPMLKEDKDPTKPLNEQRKANTENLSKKEIEELLKDPNLSNDQKNELVEELYRDIPIK